MPAPPASPSSAGSPASAPASALSPARPGPGGLPEAEPAALARSRQLQQLILARIAQAGGWLAFDEYMRLALYAPGLGYYDAAGSKFGPGGDFVTAPEISPLFGRALAAQVAQAFERLPAQVLEFGAGTGALAHDLLHELQRRGRAAQRYFIVEVSADLRARQQQRLAGLPVTWLDALPEAFEGVILANEVLDVLPVRLFVCGAGGPRERGVVDGGGTLRFGGRPADEEMARGVAAIEAEAGTLPEGYGSELCPLAAAWIGAVAACLRRGLVLLIDYGFPRREYYHPQRAMGTLMCHYRQHAHADPLWLPGLNDITAHVDFSACAAAAAAAGLDLAGYTSQAHLLMNCGILELLAADPAPARSGAVQRLLSEAEMGELVKAMALTRGYEGELLGFARGDRRHRL
jgi:SAM-dependent MidA family methyltransferase